MNERMTVLRVIARPLLASMFVAGGVASLKSAREMAPAANDTSDALKQTLGVSASPADLVRLNGAVHVVAGLALATGRFPRLASLALASTMPATTLAGHAFWNESDPAARANQRIHFLKNLSMTGGLLMASLDPDPHKKILVRRAKDRVVQAAGQAADRVEDLRS
jgi:putative oxidoreductase